MVEIRPIALADLARLVEIYNHYIATTHYTFDTEPYTAASRRPWFDQFDGKRHQCHVLESSGSVVGYACSAPLKPKAAYGTSVEVSVYLAHDVTGRGQGQRLYTRLFDSLAGQDLHRAYALIALPNAASIALHRAFDFREVAHLNEVGRKFDRYWDVVYLEKTL